jgi:hypothetical protein
MSEDVAKLDRVIAGLEEIRDRMKQIEAVERSWRAGVLSDQEAMEAVSKLLKQA